MSQGTMFGVGVGPGDPELVTVKAARVLAEAPVVAFFAKRGKSGNNGTKPVTRSHADLQSLSDCSNGVRERGRCVLGGGGALAAGAAMVQHASLIVRTNFALRRRGCQESRRRGRQEQRDA